MDHIISSSDQGEGNSGPLVHLKLRVDSSTSPSTRDRAEERAGETRQEADCSQGVHDVAFELAPEKLDVLVYELAQALALMRTTT